MIRHVFTPAFILMLFTAQAQQHRLEKLWETDTIIAVPESVLPQGDIMYVSLIDGTPWGEDGKGGVATIDRNGKHYNGSLVQGLNAPKGLAILNQKLYVADIGEVVVVDVKNGRTLKRISIPGASGLNDVTVSDGGSVYVSDSKTGRIWKIDSDKPKLFLENVEGVNGLKAVGNHLIVAAGKSFISVDAQKNRHTIAQLPQGGDGIEPIGNGDYLVTSWSGAVYYVHAGGTVDTLLDTSKEKKNAADIGYDPQQRIVYVPTFNGKTIAAYRLN